jgi:hypothetical protein
MPQGKQRTLQNIQTFIRRRLPGKLRRDLQKLRIVKEADVECATYHHLRRYIGEDPRWRVLARKHVPVTGRYVDLVIFKDHTPTIAFELKWGQLNIGNKDRRSLVGALEKLGVNKAYWLSAVSSDKPRKRLVKKTVERHVLHRIIVRLGLSGQKLEEWKRRRTLFRSKMAVGRGRKLIRNAAAQNTVNGRGHR